MEAPDKTDAVRALERELAGVAGVARAHAAECPADVAVWAAAADHAVLRLAGASGRAYGFLVLGLQDRDEVEVHLEVARWSPAAARHLAVVAAHLRARLPALGYRSAYTYTTLPHGGTPRFARFLAHVGFSPPVQAWISRTELGADGPR
ncbi:MAG: hypothetical protein H6828_02555 [Planctomycetes bacterium]|nr:hypothetical protein [Planctomycetota bacterium]